MPFFNVIAVCFLLLLPLAANAQMVGVIGPRGEVFIYGSLVPWLVTLVLVWGLYKGKPTQRLLIKSVVCSTLRWLLYALAAIVVIFIVQALIEFGWSEQIGFAIIVFFVYLSMSGGFVLPVFILIYVTSVYRSRRKLL